MRFLLLSSLCISLLTQACSSGHEAEQPNVIVILSDDQGWGDLSVQGNTNISTPNIDGLARAGASLENFYVCAVCSPTRAELLTGRYHFRGGVYSTGGGGERLDMDETTMAEVFRQAGYRTAAYGKGHNGMQYPYHPNGRGFEDYYGFCSGHWGNYYSPMLEHNGKIVKGEGFIIDDFTNHGLDFMEEHAGEPFFLYLPFNTPHTPFQAPEEYWDRYRNKEITMLSDHEDEDMNETRAALAMCENIDWNVGRIVEKTRELGIEDNTIIIYFSDNGPNTWRWNGGMKGKKGSVDEGGVRSPMFIKWPGKIEAGKKVETLASVTDLLPTLSELCGIPCETMHPLDGTRVTNSILKDDSGPEDRYLLNYWDGRISIRSQRYRLDPEGGLYDIVKDRGQTKDLGDQLPEIREQMEKVAESYRVQIDRELPEEDPRPFYLGHPALKYTQIPARDGTAHGQIERSNRWPNCSFFTNWISKDDSLSWQVEVPQEGTFKVALYYTCPEGDEGSRILLSVGESYLESKITEAFDPPLRGMEEDLTPRMESYVKDWKEMDMGTIDLTKGTFQMSLKALDMPGNSVMDFRLFLFERI
ncbi:MAG: arylsulfatase [Bacteroidales bacterium]|nr:arylsulfatase [Bacteroidales bacterium]